ncbi:MAG: hypothetical protein QOI57_2566 [Rubrobacteraceae bacterium]|nr:hypothetical protein [Rubrobacteraceae bacterium]
MECEDHKKTARLYGRLMGYCYLVSLLVIILS